MKLTKLQVEKFSIPEAGQALYWDDELRGFGVRVTPSGARSYIVQARVNGKTRRITLGAHGRLTCDEARRKARIELVGMDDGVDPQVEKKRKEAQAVTLRDVVKSYCQDRRTAKGGELKPSTVASIEYHLATNLPDWADKPVTYITRDRCSERFGEMTKRSPAQANQCFRVLRALLNYAREAYRPGGVPTLPENPVSILSGKKMWNPAPARKTRIPMEKVGAIWNLLQDRRTGHGVATIGQAIADVIVFLLLTGCRWGEAAELTWDRVSPDFSYFSLPKPKNNNPVIFPLPAPAREMLKARQRIKGNDYVFPHRSGVGHVRNSRFLMDSVSAIAEMHLSNHDLRRTYIAIGQKLNIELWRLKLLTNHVSKGDVTIDHYTETNDMRYLSGEAERIAVWIVEQGKIAAGQNVIPLRGAA